MAGERRAGCSLILLVALVLGPTTLSHAQPTPGSSGVLEALAAIPERNRDWDAVDAAMVRTLFEADREVVLQDLQESREDLTVLVARLDVHLRAGRSAEPARLLRELISRPDFLEGNLAAGVGDFLIARKEVELAIELLRACPGIDIRRTQAIVSHVAHNQGDAAADALLEELASTGRDQWLWQWIRFRTARRGAEGIFQSLQSAVIDHPTSLERAQRYIRAAREEGKGRDIGWLGDVCRPKSASEGYILGRELRDARAFPAAVALLKHSRSIPVTDEDRLRMNRMVAMMVVEPEPLLRKWTAEALAEAYLEMGRADLSQPYVEELAQMEREFGKLPSHTLALAGQVQAQSGRRTVEGMVLEREEPEAGSPEYWLARASYYAGRGEHDETRAAFERALSVCAKVGGPDGTEAAGMCARALRAWVGYLRAREKFADAVALLRAELTRAAPGSHMQRIALSEMNWIDSHHNYETIDHRDELLWEVLAATVRWDSVEEECLRRMLKRADGRDDAAVMSRAEALCQNADPSRARIVGTVCQHRDPERAVRLLEDALDRLEQEHDKRRTASTLLMAYIELGRAGEAEAILPSVIEGFAERDITECLARIALAAAKTGDRERALRLWQRVVNIDAADMRFLPRLAEAGLREDLRHFYLEWQRSDSDSWVPAQALRTLADAGA